MTWRLGTLVGRREEGATARTLVVHVPGWTGHLAGQHVDVRLTAADGYTATRSYSIASAADGETVELTVQPVPDGEVSPYLAEVLPLGGPVELRGPLGGWFVWRPEQAGPVQLVAGGSGIVPLTAMLRAHERSDSSVPMWLLYATRTPESVLYRAELARFAAGGSRAVTYAYSRTVPAGWPRPPSRVDAELLGSSALPPDQGATCYVCGPTGFVERVADLLTAAGHDPARIRTERFGPSGGTR